MAEESSLLINADPADVMDDSFGTESENVPDLVKTPEDKEAPVVLIRTRISKAVLSYLPPPLVRTIRQADPVLHPYVGEEASITILGSILLAYLLYQLIKQLSYNGKAIVDDDENILAQTLQRQAYSETILLLGPPRAGKTRLFYQLCHNLQVQTVISLRPNVGFHNDLRFMDYPGHLTFSSQIQEMLREKPRILLILDATQSVATAAQILLQVLASSPASPQILVCCNKSDKAGVKNAKRIRLQVRAELERLLKTRTQHDEDDEYGNLDWYKPGETIVLEDIADIAFLSTSFLSGEGLDQVQEFVMEGRLPEAAIVKR
jgi:signal recognition particle receptor subunit beta